MLTRVRQAVNRRLVWFLCDVHTCCQLFLFRVDDWLEYLDPTEPFEQRGSNETADED